MKDKIILASGSPRRRELLESMGLRFEVCVAGVSEWEDFYGDPREMAVHNALIKARHVSEKFSENVVLAADTIVALGNEVFNKPADMADAERMLMRLSGKKHHVYTGICLKKAGAWEHSDCVVSEVEFLDLSLDLIRQYFSIVNPLDKSGSYAIQEGRNFIIKHYSGSLSNVMGLPVEFLENFFKTNGLWDVFRIYS